MEVTSFRLWSHTTDFYHDFLEYIKLRILIVAVAFVVFAMHSMAVSFLN